MEYTDFDIEFIKRTVLVIEQYEVYKYQLEENERFDVTLLTNSLLALIVFPKEKFYSTIPTQRILTDLKKEMGIIDSFIPAKYKNFRDLIVDLRHSIAHLNIKFESDEETHQIKKIIFFDDFIDNEIAIFHQNELINFIRYYASWQIKNIIEYKSRNKN